MFEELTAIPIIDEDVEFLPLVSIDEEEENEEEDQYGPSLPILPLRNTVLFPGVVLPITVGREQSIKALKLANDTNKYIGVITQKDSDIDEPEVNDLHTMGTVAKIVKLLKMPNEDTTVIIQGRERFAVKKITQVQPFISADIEVLEKENIDASDKLLSATISSIRDFANEIVNLSPNIPDEAAIVLKNVDNPRFLLHFISSNLDINANEKQLLLQINDFKERCAKVLDYLNTELQMLQLKDKIQSKVRTDMEKQQRDYFLHQQLKTIQEELGSESGGSELEDFIRRAKSKHWNESVQKAFHKEIKRLKRLNPAMPEYSLALNYIELLLDLPWQEFTKDSFELSKAKKVLDKDHYGLEKVKERILEYLAVLKLKNDMKSPILCFVGPPGVGKTSLGRSIAKSLNRKYVRMSLGGLRDEAELRGHRRTYIGAMPGRIIQSIKKVNTSNPVFILDEIDKIGSDFRGDPASALLEILDPEQNHTFYDNYLEQDYDLSKVMFIATANSLNTLHPALRDRMEIVRLSGYSLEEKLEIAKKHLIPKLRSEHGLKARQIKLGKNALTHIIANYTRESGVRELSRKIAALMRSVAKSVALEETYSPSLSATAIEQRLGPTIYQNDTYKNDNPPGVTVGLAWTQVGGDILFIETILSKGKGKLITTGNLGDVMKESVSTALSYIRANAARIGISDMGVFDNSDIHVHVPEGAIPKDGPSAGITMLTALASAFTNKKVRPYLAMTGEITLRGKVLGVGGIKEKILAARRAGIKEVILPSVNQKDVAQVNAAFIKDLKFYYVKKMQEVIDIAFS